MARVLIVGCGCRGAELAGALVEEGHAVRGTTRREEELAPIEAAGAEAVLGDPDRLSTLMPQLEGVSVLCWLLGTASGTPEAIAALHGPRLESLVEALVDTPARGVVYEAAGTVEPAVLKGGVAIVERAALTYRMPVSIVAADPASRAAWVGAMRAAVGRILGG